MSRLRTKGLEGVVFDTTSISKAWPEKQLLSYRGYPVAELAEKKSFEEVAYLLLYAELPSKSQLEEFSKEEKKHRSLADNHAILTSLFSKKAHPMDCARTSASLIGANGDFELREEEEENKKLAIKLIAQLPTAIAANYRWRQGKDIIEPSADLSFCENFFQMCFGNVPDKRIVKAFEASLILYAEHGFNASTFTARVVTSTLSDMASAVVAAISSLKGPLHGGANEQVMHTLKEIDSAQNVDAWLEDALREKKKIMGFGHRLYRSGDSRVPTMSMYRDLVAELTSGQKWLQISSRLSEQMISKKGIHPNLDFPAGPCYYMMGFEIDFFTPIFVISRICGWSAHIIEQRANNRLVRPLSEYTGAELRPIGT